MLDANQIKIRLIDFILAHENNQLIASEVAFYQGYRKADLIRLDDGQAIAFEIKSDRDTLLNAEMQLEDYKKTFDFCYLVTTNKHIKTAKTIVSGSTGLIVVEGNHIKVLRPAKENKRLCKHSLSLSLPKNCLNELSKDKQQKANDMSTLRRHAEKATNLELLKKMFYNTLLEKYSRQYKNFISDRGAQTTLSDLYYLQSC